MTFWGIPIWRITLLGIGPTLSMEVYAGLSEVSGARGHIFLYRESLGAAVGYFGAAYRCVGGVIRPYALCVDLAAGR